MIKGFAKNVFRIAGLDVARYNRALTTYQSLYEKYKPYTMMPKDLFVINMDLCARFAYLPGDYVECGVWKGGMSAAISEAFMKNKHVHLFDSFEGLPPAKEIDGKAAIKWQADTSSPNYYDNCSAEERLAVEAMQLAGHTSYTIYKGWFDKTTPSIKCDSIGILCLDGDWYDSILVCLRTLFEKVTEGGIVILDDYYQWEGCSRAVHDYLSETKSSSRVFQWNDQIAYIIKNNG